MKSDVIINPSYNKEFSRSISEKPSFSLTPLLSDILQHLEIDKNVCKYFRLEDRNSLIQKLNSLKENRSKTLKKS